MSRLQPFADLLAGLRAAGIAIGVDDHLAVERLVDRYDGADRDELADALAALLGRSEAEVARIRREFDALYPPRAIAAEHKRPRRRLAAALVLLSVVVAIAAAVVRDPGPASPSAPPVVAPTAPATTPACAASRPAVDSLRSALPPWLGLGLLGVAAAMFAVQRARGRRQWARNSRRRRLENLPGPRGYQIAAGAQLSRALLDDLAILLAARSETREIDVERTVERTVRSGLAPVLAFRSRRRRQPVAVAIDREPEMRAFRAAASELARGLRDRGVVVEQPAGLTEPQLADAVAIVVSTGAALADPGARVPVWIVERARQRRLVWLSPIEDARRWPAALRTARVPIYPFSRAGLVAAARYLGGEDPLPPSAPPLQWDDVERLRAMLAIALDPAPAVAERLRGMFLPHAPRSIHVAVRDEPLPDVAHAAAWLSQVEPGLDARVRRFLLELLITAEPPAGSAGHLRWRRDRAMLMSGLPEHAGEARHELVELANGRRGDAIADGPMLKRGSGDPPRLPWSIGTLSWLVPLEAAIATLVTPLIPRTPSFDDAAYTLRVETEGSRRRLRVEPVVAQVLELYDHGARVGELAGSFEVPEGAHCYQVWQLADRDHYEGSPPLFVEQVDDQPGTLVINFTSSFEGALADQTYLVAEPASPLRRAVPDLEGRSGVPLVVPAGAWTARASRPGYASWSQGLTITAGRPLVIDATLSPGYGIVRFVVEPPGARKGIEIEAAAGFQVIDGELHGVGPGTATLRAPGYRPQDVAFSVQPRELVAVQVELVAVAGAQGSAGSGSAGACAGVNADDLMAQAQNQYAAGFSRAALALARKALACKQDDRMYRLAAMYACASHDEASARRYLPKMTVSARAGIIQKCIQEGIDLTVPPPGGSLKQ